jgi:predicted lipoprotein with Yx(FWY)xxD motif
MYLKKSAILIICGLLLVVLSTACSGTTGNTPDAAATTAAGTQQANNQSNGTSQLDNQNTRADGQMQVTPTPAPTKASSQSDKGHDADDQNKTNNNKNVVKPTPTPVTNTKKSSQSSSTSNNNSQNNNSNQSSNNNNYNNSAKVATPTTTSGGTMYISTRVVTINGTAMNVLTNGQGMTLYYRTSDPAPASTCTGNCAATWPPLLNHNMNIITSQTLNGTLTVQQTANGPQVLYNNHPLYTYVGDNAAGQANGHGLDGVWYVVQVQAQKMHW